MSLFDTGWTFDVHIRFGFYFNALVYDLFCRLKMTYWGWKNGDVFFFFFSFSRKNKILQPGAAIWKLFNHSENSLKNIGLFVKWYSQRWAANFTRRITSSRIDIASVSQTQSTTEPWQFLLTNNSGEIWVVFHAMPDAGKVGCHMSVRSNYVQIEI